MWVELGLVEQRHKAVLEVFDGATVTDVARRYVVSRQSVHAWLRRYASQGLAGLADRSSKSDGCPHQMAPELEAKVVEMRLAHPGVGAEDDRVAVEGGGGGAVAGPVVDLSAVGPSRSGRGGPTAPAPGGLQALGALQGDGGVADGHRGAVLSGRWDRTVRVDRGG